MTYEVTAIVRLRQGSEISVVGEEIRVESNFVPVVILSNANLVKGGVVITGQNV